MKLRSEDIMNYPVHIVSVGGLIENDEGKILLLKSPDRVKRMMSAEDSINYDVFSRNPYVHHGEQYI
jgi:hypothetical protein